MNYGDDTILKISTQYYYGIFNIFSKDESKIDRLKI